MSYIIDCARHEVVRLRAISRKLSELKLAAIKEETDMLQVLVSAMDWKLHAQRPPLSKANNNNKDPEKHGPQTPRSPHASSHGPVFMVEHAAAGAKPPEESPTAKPTALAHDPEIRATPGGSTH